MQESYSQSASRHLMDAQILWEAQRWDNAVYLASYVVECSFKLLVEQYFKNGKTATKKYGHELTELQGTAMERLRVLYPFLDRELPASRIDGTVLAQHHPERRYAESELWTEEEANLAIERAEEVYREIIPKLVLNGSISSKEM